MRRLAGALAAALVIGTGLGAIAGAGPAAAGGWAVTVLDPLPNRIEAGRAYEVSFWVLQHGTHPYNWGEPASLGQVGVTLTDDRSASVSFTGRALAEPAHYTTAVTVPHDGTWRVSGVQGIFMDFHVGTLTVPGSLKALGVPAAPSAADLQKYWPGAVRPPVLPIDQNRDPFVAEPQRPPDQSAARQLPAPPAVEADPPTVSKTQSALRAPVLAAVIAGVALVLGFGVGGRRLWIRSGRRAPDSQSSGSASPR
jgi:hypothetical protein